MSSSYIAVRSCPKSHSKLGYVPKVILLLDRSKDLVGERGSHRHLLQAEKVDRQAEAPGRVAAVGTLHGNDLAAAVIRDAQGEAAELAAALATAAVSV